MIFRLTSIKSPSKVFFHFDSKTISSFKIKLKRQHVGSLFSKKIKSSLQFIHQWKFIYALGGTIMLLQVNWLNKITKQLTTWAIGFIRIFHLPRKLIGKHSHLYPNKIVWKHQMLIYYNLFKKQNYTLRKLNHILLLDYKLDLDFMAEKGVFNSKILHLRYKSYKCLIWLY